MKHAIAWYEENLKNSTKYYEDTLKRIADLQQDANRSKDSNDFLREQILQAKIQHKDSFDANKFLKRRK